jgi:RNA recognition motif-containing protein
MAKLFIGNLPHSSSDTQLRYWVELRGFRVASAEVICDRITGKSRGFGLVTLGDDADLPAAISVLNGRRMDGRVLTVNEATPLTEASERLASEGKPSPVQDRP